MSISHQTVRHAAGIQGLMFVGEDGVACCSALDGKIRDAAHAEQVIARITMPHACEAMAKACTNALLADRCTGCSQPAHASETDDDGYHPQCRPAHDELQHIPVLSVEPAVVRIAKALAVLVDALPHAGYVTISANTGSVSISCKTDEGTRALASAAGLGVSEVGNATHRWLASASAHIGPLLVSIYGPHREIVTPEPIDERRVAAALAQAEAAL